MESARTAWSGGTVTAGAAIPCGHGEFGTSEWRAPLRDRHSTGCATTVAPRFEEKGRESSSIHGRPATPTSTFILNRWPDNVDKFFAQQT